MCLDFGTAMSKAWASRREDGDSIPLALKQASGRREFAVPSVIFISSSGKIYFGADAETQHRQDIARPPFDNIKRMLTDAEIGLELDDVPLPEGVDPTKSGLAKGDLLVLYLAWFTDLALESLSAQEEQLASSSFEHLRYVRRRFAIPCFESAEDESKGSERADWARGVLERSLLRAQVVADTLKGKWNGLTADDASSLLRMCRRDVEPNALVHLLAEAAPVREPVAAGASRFSEEIDNNQDSEGGLVRRTLLVIDAGAGTTDFALFQVFQESDNIQYALIRPSVRMCALAGNAIDEILMSVVLEGCGINPESGYPRSPENFAIAMTNLRAEIRDIKREVFGHGERLIALRPNVSGTVLVDHILKHDAYKRIETRLLEIRNQLIESVFSTARLRPNSRYPVHVLLTGGSSTLPAIRKLAEGSIWIRHVQFSFSLVRETPSWIDNLERSLAELVASRYPQCAVAIGGSSRELPREVQDLNDLITPALPGARVLEHYAVRGDSE